MFEEFTGLHPDVAARWVALVEECRPLLANDGMEAVQAFLVEREVNTIPTIAITRALLGRAETPLRVAIDIVATSTARQASSQT
ncbi:hypothetical protein [Streptomyces maremycinicus]|uniref:hypothetical protein n=1 Tax=Streptomyces maremycinicus TaxID=1679753 RepID=UPI0007882718|nr:hypothetical protein [Streptomyces sp. NBRC 110468]